MPDESSNETSSRRRFLRRLALASGTGVLLAGCGGSENADSTPPQNASDAPSTGDASNTAASSGSTNQCVEPAALPEEAKAGRKKYAYVAESPHDQKRCDNCQFWVAAEEGATCGGCRLFPGPVHPEGYCNAWLRA